MKLSEKGWDRLLYEALYWDEDIANEALEWSNIKQEYKLRHIEFEPDDFEGVVVLTLDEAKRIVDSLHRAIKAHVEVSRLTNGWVEVSIEENDIYMLKEKIEQAEGK